MIKGKCGIRWSGNEGHDMRASPVWSRYSEEGRAESQAPITALAAPKLYTGKRKEKTPTNTPAI